MKIQLYCPGESRRGEIDSFWVECTVREAGWNVFPLLSKQEIIESCKYWEPRDPERINWPYDRAQTDLLCFLISKDLKTIMPEAWRYPYAAQWNGYCPFRKIDGIDISDLNEIQNIVTKTEENNDDA